MPSSHAHSWLPQNCINFVKPLVLNGTMPFYRIGAKFQLPANASRRTCAVTRRGSQGWLGFAFPPTLAPPRKAGFLSPRRPEFTRCHCRRGHYGARIFRVTAQRA